MKRRAIFLLPALALPARAEVAPPFPRPLVLAEDTVLRLGDIFENAGALADRTVGAAPAPGRRITLDASQLSGLARRHGLAWRPLSGEERSVVERPGRPLPREDVEAMLRDELSRLGLDADAELELPGFSPPLVPLGVLPQVMVEAPYVDTTSRRFAVTLVVSAEGMATQRIRLAGRAVPTVPVVIAARRMAVGDIVGPEDLREIRQRAERVRPGTAQRAEDVVGKQLRRPIGSDLPFMTVDLVAPSVISKNQLVLMVLEGPGISLTAQGRAMEAASLGQMVPVMNLMSRSVVEAEAIGPGRVRVRPGSTPVTVARRG